jgi:hypothetical protein
MTRTSLLKVLLAAAILSATALPLTVQQTKPCVAEDERKECTTPAKVDTIEEDRAPLKPALQSTHVATPEVPLDFEKYVEQSVGYRVPMFGRELFASSPSTFAPASDTPIPADYVIGPGDELVIRGWGQVEINARAAVDRSGQIFLPKVGMISVAGIH